MSEIEGSSAQQAGGRLSIDLDALAANYQALADQAAPARCGAVVKANGYGLGMEPVARRLAASGCDCFFVASLAEAQFLREVVPAADIYVLEGIWPEQLAAFTAADLLPVINSPVQLALWARPGTPRRCIVQVDTGMSRLGLTPAEFRHLAGDTSALDGICVDYLMTHLACADEPEHSLNQHPAATPVGYGAEYRARGQTQLATLGLGYADGYPRSLGNRGYGVVHGQRVPVVGRVSMDSLVVDVTRLGEGKLSPGDFVQLLGDEVDIDELARLGGTISYELLTGLGARLERRYTGLV
jgi:alanine racemase